MRKGNFRERIKDDPKLKFDYRELFRKIVNGKLVIIRELIEKESLSKQERSQARKKVFQQARMTRTHLDNKVMIVMKDGFVKQGVATIYYFMMNSEKLVPADELKFLVTEHFFVIGFKQKIFFLQDKSILRRDFGFDHDRCYWSIERDAHQFGIIDLRVLFFGKQTLESGYILDQVSPKSLDILGMTKNVELVVERADFTKVDSEKFI